MAMGAIASLLDQQNVRQKFGVIAQGRQARALQQQRQLQQASPMGQQGQALQAQAAGQQIAQQGQALQGQQLQARQGQQAQAMQSQLSQAAANTGQGGPIPNFRTAVMMGQAAQQRKKKKPLAGSSPGSLSQMAATV